jgi:hypothetical protein
MGFSCVNNELLRDMVGFEQRDQCVVDSMTDTLATCFQRHDLG